MKFLKRIFLAPLSMLFGIPDGGDGAGGSPSAPPSPPASTAPAVSSATPDEIAAAFVKALDERTGRAERAVIGSLAKQYGMSEDDVTSILSTEKAKRDAQLPDEAQQRINAALNTANERLISAEVRVQCSELGIVDSDAALILMSRDGVKVNDNGTVEGVKEALEALKTAKPYLAKTADTPPAGTGSAGNFARTGGTDYATQLADARQRGDRVAEVRIISEAAQKGINLR